MLKPPEKCILVMYSKVKPWFYHCLGSSSKHIRSIPHISSNCEKRWHRLNHKDKPSTTYPYQKRGSLDIQWLRFRCANAFFLFKTNSCNFIFTSVLATAPEMSKIKKVI